MAKKNNLPTRDIPGLFFVKNPYRSDLNFFSFDLDELKKEVNKNTSYRAEIYEVQFWTKKPTFKKLTLTEQKKLNIL